MNLRFTIVALVLATLAIGAFAAGQTEAATTETGPMTITWAGLPLATKGGELYPDTAEAITQELNKALNIDLQPVKVNPVKREQMNLLFAAGEIPDQILVGDNDMLEYWDQGLLRRIPEDMIKQYAPTYWKDYATGMIGGYYKNLPSYDAQGWIGLPNGLTEMKTRMVVRKDWLEKVGMKAPTTTDEFMQMARLFTENDPDGDGKKDTYGLSASASDYWEISLAHIWAAFGYEHVGNPVMSSDGKVTFFNITSNFKDALRYMSELYGKGYMYPDITLKDRIAIGSLFTDDITGTVQDTWTWVLPDYRPGSWFELYREKHPDSTWTYLEPLTAPGHTNTWEERAAVWRYHTIGKDVSDAKLAKILEVIEIQLADKYYHNLVWSGIEGQHFEFDKTGMRQFIGDYTGLEKQGALGSKFYLTNIRYGWMFGASFGKYAEEFEKGQASWNIVPPVLGYGWVLDSQKEVGADANAVRDAYMWQAITGKANFTSDWDTYVKNWLNAGGKRMIDEANQIYQSMKK